MKAFLLLPFLFLIQAFSPGMLINNRKPPVPVAAFSTRRVISNWAGIAMRVRRASDDTVLNINFLGSGELDTASLLSFCSSTSCFVMNWSDQTGNGFDAYQPDFTKQPRIVNAGALDTMNGRAALTWPAPSDTNQVVLEVASGTWQTICAVRDTVAGIGGGAIGGADMQYLITSPLNADHAIRFASTVPGEYGDHNSADWSSGVNGRFFINGKLTYSFTPGTHQLCAMKPTAFTATLGIGTGSGTRNLSNGDHVGEILVYSTLLPTTASNFVANKQKAAWSIP